MNRPVRSWCLAAAACLATGCVAPQHGDGTATADVSAAHAQDPSTAKADSASPRVSLAESSKVEQRKKEAIGLNSHDGPTPLASVEKDQHCKQLVAPFSLSDNATILAELAKGGVMESITMAFDLWVRGGTAAVASRPVGATAQHNISYELRATALRLNWLPMETEVLYGRSVLDTMIKSGHIIPADTEGGRRFYPKAQQLLESSLGGIIEPYDYRFEIYLSTRPEQRQNAVALPGGIIILGLDLVKDPTLARKASFALAHELGHVLQRHETRALQARVIDAVSLRGTLSDLLKVIGESKREPLALVTLAMSSKLQFERHFASQELHSDSCAVRILHRTLPSESELTSVLAAFIAALPPAKPDDRQDPTNLPADATSAGTPISAKTTSSLTNLIDLSARPVDLHPTTAERVKNLNAVLAELKDQHRRPREMKGTVGRK